MHSQFTISTLKLLVIQLSSNIVWIENSFLSQNIRLKLPTEIFKAKKGESRKSAFSLIHGGWLIG
jgi:hypothetical protein